MMAQACSDSIFSQSRGFLKASRLRLPFQKLVGKFGEEPSGFTHWREGLLRFLHLAMGVAAGLIEAQEFGERDFLV